MKRDGLKLAFDHTKQFSLVLAILMTIALTPGVDAMGAGEHPQDAAVPKSLSGTSNRSFGQLMEEAMAIMHRAMENANKTGDPDHDFVTMMIPLHQGAIDMAKVVLRDGKDSDIREFAETIIEDQQAEIGLMEGWLTKYKPTEGESPNKTFVTAMERIDASMDRDMRNAKKIKDPDHDFVMMMIPHHQGAIDMAKLVLIYGKDPEVRRLAGQVVAAQQSEIQIMQRWLTTRDE